MRGGQIKDSEKVPLYQKDGTESDLKTTFKTGNFGNSEYGNNHTESIETGK